jgi:hypothetical protein
MLFALQMGRFSGGLMVTVTPFDADGWEMTPRSWSPKVRGDPPSESLAAFLESFAELSPEESEALAGAIEGEWLADFVDRGGVAYWREMNLVITSFLVGAVVVALLALLGIALLILLFV